MIVSILQLMGFPMGKPVHSRAGETPSERPLKAKSGDHGTKDHAQASPARRQEVKAKPGKSTPSKPAAKAPVKAAAKKATKPVVKASAKPVTKAAVKPAPKKAAAKPVVKAVAKVAPPKAKPKTPAKAIPPAMAKPAAKAAAKPVTKAPVKAAAPVKPVVKSVAKLAPVVSASKEKVPAPMPQTVPKAAPAPVAPAVAAVPQKAGRPSSRLAQLTVPSMAQSVASTAAKASYSPSIPSPVIVPALPSSIKKDPKLANNWKTKPVAELTDAELMAMPDSEYMNDVQMAAFRLKLSKLKQDILASAGETTEHLREDTSVVPDPADRATIEEEHALELRTRDRERKLLKKIEQSIVRIDAGDYGYCDETGEPIGVGRLLARPTATLSLEAQQRRELKQKMFGD
ncbi:MAG: RNA polymerase-binding protein DksA [Burkholderiales bacterium]|nr:RNA polymerase-binding protein DksA [Burkholderiales bacterium]